MASELIPVKQLQFQPLALSPWAVLKLGGAQMQLCRQESTWWGYYFNGKESPIHYVHVAITDTQTTDNDMNQKMARCQACLKNAAHSPSYSASDSTRQLHTIKWKLASFTVWTDHIYISTITDWTCHLCDHMIQYYFTPKQAYSFQQW